MVRNIEKMRDEFLATEDVPRFTAKDALTIHDLSNGDIIGGITDALMVGAIAGMQYERQRQKKLNTKKNR